MLRIARQLIVVCIVATLTMFVGLFSVTAAPTVAITVNTVSDTEANDQFCTFREAIQAANSDSAVGGCTAGSGEDTIGFAIPGNGPHLIQVTSNLPFLTAPVTIDGYTQAGAQPNTNTAPQALNSVLKIVLDGSQNTEVAIHYGFVIEGGSSTIRGIVINNFDIGIWIHTQGENRITGNFIGTNVSGTVAAPINGTGILVESSFNTIGTEASGAKSNPGERNLISGIGVGATVLTGDDVSNNSVQGVASSGAIALTGEDSYNNSVQGNLIGTDITAAKVLSNTGSGISILDVAFDNTLRDNVIAGNNDYGIRIENAASDSLIVGNYIGTNGAGAALGNGNGGILARNSGPQTIGGLYTAGGCCIGNTIAFNQGNGVTILADISVSLEKGILGNRIYGNTKLGIDLRDDGVTPNDEGDADGENDANHLQNFPELTAARVLSNNITITGTLNTITDTSYRIDFFANDECDPSGYGEGQRVIGTNQFTTDADGNLSFTITFTGTVPALANSGNFITATATDLDGNTSEFSQCKEATGEKVEAVIPSLFVPLITLAEEEE